MVHKNRAAAALRGVPVAFARSAELAVFAGNGGGISDIQCPAVCAGGVAGERYLRAFGAGEFHGAGPAEPDCSAAPGAVVLKRAGVYAEGSAVGDQRAAVGFGAVAVERIFRRGKGRALRQADRAAVIGVIAFEDRFCRVGAGKGDGARFYANGSALAVLSGDFVRIEQAVGKLPRAVAFREYRAAGFRAVVRECAVA